MASKPSRLGDDGCKGIAFPGFQHVAIMNDPNVFATVRDWVRSSMNQRAA
jgi:hypothetical protein